MMDIEIGANDRVVKMLERTKDDLEKEIIHLKSKQNVKDNLEKV